MKPPQANQWLPGQSPIALVKRIENLNITKARIALRMLFLNNPTIHKAMIDALDIAESH